MHLNLIMRCFKSKWSKLFLPLSYWTKLVLQSNTLWASSFRYSIQGQFLFFNTKFTYFKIFNVTWDFDSVELFSNILKLQLKDNKVIAICNRITIKMWFPLPVSICLPSQCWAFPVPGKEYMGSREPKPAALFKVHFVGCTVFYTLCWAEPLVRFTHAGLAGLGRHSHILYEGTHFHTFFHLHFTHFLMGKAIYTTSWSTQLIEPLI